MLARLAVEASDKGKGEQFAALQPYLTGYEPQLSYAVTASALEMSDAAVKVAVHRLRTKFRDVVREEIAQTVASPADIEDELRHLWSAVRR